MISVEILPIWLPIEPESWENPAFPDRNIIDGVLAFDGVLDDKIPSLFKQYHTSYDECIEVIAEDART